MGCCEDRAPLCHQGAFSSPGGNALGALSPSLEPGGREGLHEDGGGLSKLGDEGVAMKEPEKQGEW